MKINKRLLFIGLVLMAMLSRVIPHAPNFTAVTAAGLFAGFAFSSQMRALLVPIISLWISDLVINNVVYATYYDGFVFFTEEFYWVYAGLIISVIIGMLGINKLKMKSLLISGLGATVVFYLITNFGVWLGSPTYAQNFGGLIASYIAGLPFLLNQVLGTLFYGAILFGAAYALQSKKETAGINA